MDSAITNNTASSRFELEEQGHLAYAEYYLAGDTLRIDYVYAPEALRGTGTAGRLLQGVLEQARASHLRIHPVCGYAASWLRRHAEDADLVA